MTFTPCNSFDPRLAGKWVSHDFKPHAVIPIFLHIHYDPEKGVAVQAAYKHAHQWFGMVYTEYSYDALYFFHNDRRHRTECLLSAEADGRLRCEYTMKNCFGYDGTYANTLYFSPLTVEEEKKYRHAVAPKDAPKIDILREYATYGDITAEINITYAFNERENCMDIIEQQGLDALCEGKSDAETAIALMGWLCKHYKHGNPPNALSKERTPQALIARAAENDHRTNCRGLSIILATLIRAYGIKAFHITCMPYEHPFDDCHVVVCAFARELNKWIMFDPTSHLYLKNEQGELIGVEEYRDLLIAGAEIIPNDDRFPNWGTADRPDCFMPGYNEYMAKNLIRLHRAEKCEYGYDSDNIALFPEKYYENERNALDTLKGRVVITKREDFWQ
jgi:hypothetical protein